jgi:hypothetical protein
MMNAEFAGDVRRSLGSSHNKIFLRADATKPTANRVALAHLVGTDEGFGNREDRKKAIFPTVRFQFHG